MARMFDALGSGSKPKTSRKTKKIDVAPVPMQELAPIQESAVEKIQDNNSLGNGFSFIEVGPKGYLVGSPDVVLVAPVDPLLEGPKIKLSTIEPEIALVIAAVLPSVNTQVSEDEGGCYADLMKSLIAEFPTKQEGTLLFVTPPAVQIADAVLKLAKEAALLGEVVLVEAKENSGNLQRWLGLQESQGWQDVVSGKAELEDCLQETNIPGLKVVMPSLASDVKSLLIASIKDPNPVIFIEDRWCHVQKIDRSSIVDNSGVEIGKAEVIEHGEDLTIVAAGFSTVQSIRAVKLLRKFKIINLN